MDETNTAKNAAVEDKCRKVFWHYMDCIDRYLNHTRTLYNPPTDAQHSFMRRLEECCDISEQGADDWRRMVVGFYWHLFYNQKKIEWRSNPHLGKAIRTFLDAFPEEDIPVYTGVTGRFRSIDDDWQAEET